MSPIYGQRPKPLEALELDRRTVDYRVAALPGLYASTSRMEAASRGS